VASDSGILNYAKSLVSCLIDSRLVIIIVVRDMAVMLLQLLPLFCSLSFFGHSAKHPELSQYVRNRQLFVNLVNCLRFLKLPGRHFTAATIPSALLT